MNLAEFYLFDAQLNRLQVRDMNTLARFSRVLERSSLNRFAPESVAFYRKYNSSFSSIFDEINVPTGLTLEGDPEPLRASFVSGDYFRALGVLPAYGRLLDGEDSKPGVQAVVVIGYGYWQDRFGSDPAIVGRTIRVNGKPLRVVGVGPASFSGIAQVRTFVWLPETLQTYLIKRTDFLTAMFGRLKPGVTFEAAESAMQALAAQLQHQQPGLFQRGEQVRVERIDALNFDPVIATIASFWILLVLLVLVAACANLGNMLLARGLARQREIKIRLAIGAGYWRIVRQLMTENLLLASIGAAVALAVGRFAAQIFVNIRPSSTPDFRLMTDWRILAAAAILTLIAVSFFGLAPTIQAVRRGRPTARAGKSLVSIQVAISCALLILSSLLIRGMRQALESGVSIDSAHMMVADPGLYLEGLGAPSARQDLDDGISGLRRVPGVDGVALARIPPFGRRVWMDRVPRSSRLLYLNAVDSSYFGLLRLRFLAGRAFLPAEQDAVIVGQSAARALWPAEQPLGRELVLQGHMRTVVGVVADSGVNLIAAPTSVEVYLPLDDQSITQTVFLIHTTTKPKFLSGAVRAAASVGNRASISSLGNDLAEQTEGPGNLLLLIGALGTVATVLAAAGIFGLLAFTISQRTNEIGVRLALGGNRSRILETVLGQYLTPVGSGLLVGIAIVAAASRILRWAWVGVPSFDPLSYAAALLIFILIAFTAGLLPCRRALRIEPAAVLRHD